MNTPLSRLQHDLSLAPGIPDSYRLFGEGPTVSTYGDLRAVAGRVDNGLLPGDLEWLRNLSMDPSEPEVPDVVEAVNARIRRIVSALSAVRPSQEQLSGDLGELEGSTNAEDARVPHPDVSGLVEALEPFAKEGDDFDSIPNEFADDEVQYTNVPVGAYRRARAAVAAFQSRQEEG